MRAAALLLLALVAHGSETETNPLAKVIELMDSLAAKITKEGEAEEKAFRDYFNWCDDINRNTKNAITTLTKTKEKLEAEIAKQASAIETAESKIEELAAAIAAAEADLKAAEAIRAKEKADFEAEEKELADAVDTLGRAINILQREMAKNPAALMQVDFTSMDALVQSMNAVIDAASFSTADSKKIMALVQARTQDDDEDAGAPAAAVYKTHSTNIVEVLEDMKEKAEEQLSKLRHAEGEAAHQFNLLKQGLEDQMAADNADLAEEKKAKADAEGAKAAAEGDLEATEKDLAAAKEALAMAQQECMQVAADHQASVNGRAEELKVIAEAKKILVETSKGAVEKTYSLLQTSLGSKMKLQSMEVVGMVKQLAKTHHSAALAQLASKISAVLKYGAHDDVFAKVKGLINDMIAKLQAEAQAEAEEKAWCDEQTAKTTAKKEELEGDLAKLTAKIDTDSARSAELKDEVKELDAELAALAKTQAEMDKARQEQNAAFIETKADLELGLTGVRKALNVLRDYYQGKEEALLQQAPPPKPVFHGKAEGAGGSIIGILEVVESDFAKNLATEEQTESDAQEAYDKQTQENKITQATKEQDAKYKTQEFTGLDKEIAELSSDRDTANQELAAVLDYLKQVNERCIAKPETYEERKKRREQEIAGLKQALQILNEAPGFLQKRSFLK